MSIEAAGVYNRLPLFLMPEESDELMERESEILQAGFEKGGVNTPFEDFLLDFPFGSKAIFEHIQRLRLSPDLNTEKAKDVLDFYETYTSRGRMWVRVRSLAVFRKDAATQISPTHFEGLNPATWMLVEGWEENTTTGGLSISPDHSLIPLDRAAMFDEYLHGFPNPDCWDYRKRGEFWCNSQSCRQPDSEIQFRCFFSEALQSLMCRLSFVNWFPKCTFPNCVQLQRHLHTRLPSAQLFLPEHR